MTFLRDTGILGFVVHHRHGMGTRKLIAVDAKCQDV